MSAAKTVNAKFTGLPPTTTGSVTPKTGSCGGKIDLTYTESGNASSYRLSRYPDANNLNQWGYIAGSPSGGISFLSLPPSQSNLTADGLYQYQLEAINAVGSTNSAIKSTSASILCPDLIVQSITATKSGTPVTQIIEGDIIRFSAVIKNQGGATATTFQNQFVLDNIDQLPLSQTKPTVPGLTQNATYPVSSSIWPATIGSHSLIVCADQPPTPNGVVEEKDSTNQPAEGNNCLPFNFTVVSPLTVKLEGRKANTTDTYGTSIIVDYDPNGTQLQWTTTGNPTNCTGGDAWNGEVLTPTSPVGSKSFSISSVSQLLYTFTATCSRP